MSELQETEQKTHGSYHGIGYEADSELQQDSTSQESVGKKNVFVKIKDWCVSAWKKFSVKHPSIAQFIVFFIVCNAVTVLQMIMLPLWQLIFNLTPLVDINFQVGAIGTNIDGSTYYMFNYASGAITADGYGGGLAYFLAMQVTLGIAQVVNFITQRNVTFKAKNNVWFAAMWYLIAYICITLISAAAQGLYKAPLYSLLGGWWGDFGKTVADIVVVIITSAISFWVFFPIMKLIFKTGKPKEETVADTQEVESTQEVADTQEVESTQTVKSTQKVLGGSQE